MPWNDESYTDIVNRYPVLGTKPESVALTVWALEQNKYMTADDFRQLSEATGVEVRGRAIGSARQILGLDPGTKAGKAAPAKDKAKPKAKSDRVKPAQGDSPMAEISRAITAMHEENRALRSALERIRDLVAAVR